jgi:hypothetical protein
MASILVYSFDFKSFQSVGLHEFLIYGCLSYQNVEALLTPYLIVFVFFFFFFSPLRYGRIKLFGKDNTHALLESNEIVPSKFVQVLCSFPFHLQFWLS